MEKETISTDKAPRAVGPYSQAIKAGGWIYLSGQIPISHETNQLISGTIEEQAELVLNNAKCVLEAAGASLDNVVKVTVYLADMDDFVSPRARPCRWPACPKTSTSKSTWSPSWDENSSILRGWALTACRPNSLFTPHRRGAFGGHASVGMRQGSRNKAPPRPTARHLLICPRLYCLLSVPDQVRQANRVCAPVPLPRI